jgi:hypothetical protein
VRTDGPGTGNYPRAKGTGVDEKPKIVEREAQSYMAYGASVTMATVAEVLPPLHPELRSWLAERDIEIVGDPFFKYNLIDMEHHLEVEVGFPVAEIPSVNDRVATSRSCTSVIRPVSARPRANCSVGPPTRDSSST